MVIIGIIVSIILFSIIILIHEWGHFITARKFGVKVEEFGLGIPPRAKKIFTDKKGTLFSLNWLPIGGFVKLKGEIPNTFLVYNKNNKLYNNINLEKDLKKGIEVYNKKGNKISEAEKSDILNKILENKAEYNFMNKSSWKQAIIILAGVFMNFLLAIFIFSVLFFIGVKPIGINTAIETDLDLKIIPTYQQALESGLLIKHSGLILNPVKGSIAEQAGIKKGDILLNINGIVFNDSNKMIEFILKNKGKNINFLIDRTKKCIYNSNCIIKENIINISLTIGKNGKIGSYISENIEFNRNFTYEYGFLKSIQYGALETYNQTLLTFKGLSILITKIFNPKTPTERQEAINQINGPIGIVDFISSSLKEGIIFIFIIGALISINLGIFNLLPIPALDGGRFFFIAINGIIKSIFGKKIISEQNEGIVHVLFFLFLIALSLLIAYNDINKIFFEK